MILQVIRAYIWMEVQLLTHLRELVMPTFPDMLSCSWVPVLHQVLQMLPIMFMVAMITAEQSMAPIQLLLQ